MADLPTPPNLDILEAMALQVSTPVDRFANAPEMVPMGEPANAPVDKEGDELAQLPDAIKGQLPEATLPTEDLHPAFGGFGTKAEPSQDDFPPVPVRPRNRIDPRLLDPHGAMSMDNIWPGQDGLPFRGKAIPNIKEDDELQPKRGTEAHVDILVLSVPADLKRYTEIMQVIANGLGALGVEERIYDAELKNWRVFIRWWELYICMPKTK